jgi:uncharacterized protein (TIGR03083 family)
VTDAIPFRQSLRSSHDRLTAHVATLGQAELESISYDPDWSIADVLSHLGSQAEVFTLFVDAGLTGAEAPGQSAFPPIWDAWNAKSPEDQARDSIDANERFVASLEELDEETMESFRLTLFGMERSMAGLLRMRLSEHALHSWDIVVVSDPAATVDPDAVALLIDGVSEMVERVGKPAERPQAVAVTSHDPDRQFVLDTGGVSLVPSPASPSVDATLDLPTEAFLRLIYGRLDDAHVNADAVHLTGITLDDLRGVFTGI